MKQLSFMVFLSLSLLGYSQERITQAKKYQGGDEMLAPLYGLKIKVPANWTGYLPQDIGLFNLKCDTAKDISVSMYAQKISFGELKENWSDGKQLSQGISVVPDKVIISNDTLVYTSLRLTNDKSIKGYGFASCGEFGFCYTIILRTQARSHSKYKNLLPSLSKSFSFVDPSIIDYYELHDWQEALSSKYLYSHESITGATKQNQLWLCPNGTFKAKIVRTGLYKGEVGKYKGNQKGTYTINGKGRNGTLTLNFKKLDSIDIPLEIKEGDKIFLNGNRFFMALNQDCK